MTKSPKELEFTTMSNKALMEDIKKLLKDSEAERKERRSKSIPDTRLRNNSTIGK